MKATSGEQQWAHRVDAHDHTPAMLRQHCASLTLCFLQTASSSFRDIFYSMNKNNKRRKNKIYPKKSKPNTHEKRNKYKMLQT